MNINPPTQEEIARRAYEIWQDRGTPAGSDAEIWFEAERQLSADEPAGNAADWNNGNSSGGMMTAANLESANPMPERPFAHAAALASPSPAEAAAKALQQKKEARAPQLPAKGALNTAPTESGKPLWDKPHSR
jgi:hypothetical protein